MCYIILYIYMLYYIISYIYICILIYTYVCMCRISVYDCTYVTMCIIHIACTHRYSTSMA